MNTNQKIGEFEVLTPEQIAEQQVTSQEPMVVDPQEAAEPTPTEPQEPVTEVVTEPSSEPDNEPEVVINDASVLEYLNSKGNGEISSLEDIFKTPEPVETSAVPEYMKPLVDFIEETGRSFDDYILFQQLNPEGMSDMDAIKVQMALDYGELSQEEINILLQDKYKLDENTYDEDEVKRSKVLLKVDAAKARKQIGEFRDKYSKPIEKPVAEPTTESEPLIDDAWVNNMKGNMDYFDGLEFDLSDEKSFSFTADDNIRNQTVEELSEIENYFDRYVDQYGSWDMDALSADITLINNIDVIAKSIYKQGVSDGMRGVVTDSANVTTPGQKNLPEDPNKAPSVKEQLAAQGVHAGQTLRFNV